MTGAQRQAAYRQRKLVESIKVTVAENSDYTEKAESLREPHARQVSALRKQLAKLEAELSALRAATANQEGAPHFEVMLRLLAMASARKPVKAQLAIRESDLWRDNVARASDVSDKQMKRIVAALAGRLV
ncbi:hypothetical protein [Paraburkholderia aromaticivorans]|uniref:hypothetical protein n=1 Tax=Paraburkholderia aromaticivorans TaxID=2026199 RepID=UPI001455E598|nr:hypothetical protein [Paraburkholderia aromaticivorans]